MARRNRYLLFLVTLPKIAYVLPSTHTHTQTHTHTHTHTHTSLILPHTTHTELTDPPQYTPHNKNVAFKLSKTKNLGVFIVKSQNVVDQANSNPNNTNLTLSRRHINFLYIKINRR